MKPHLLLKIIWLSWLYCYYHTANARPTITTHANAISIAASSDNILYVDKNVESGNGSGDSWENAISELADALKWAKLNESQFTNSPLKIWVAAGTYYPMYAPDNLNESSATSVTNSFLLVRNVELYGGFSGIETTLEGRNPNLYKTILSGDYNNDDEIIGERENMTIENSSENAWRLLIGVSDLGSACLNGFEISHNAPAYSGIVVQGYSIFYSSALYLIDSKLSISQCHFTKLQGDYGTAINTFNSKLSIERSTFSHIKSTNGALYIKDLDGTSQIGDFKAINTLFFKNHSTTDGAAINFTGSSTAANHLVLNCTFVDNSTNSPSAKGVSIAVNACDVKVHNSILLQQHAPNSPGLVMLSVDGNLEIKNCLSQMLESTSNGNINASSNLSYNDIFEDASNHNYAIKYTGIAFNMGNNDLYANNHNTVDYDGQPRVVNTTIDIGAFENQHVVLPLTARLITDFGISTEDGITNTTVLTYAGVTAPFATVTLFVNGMYFHTTATDSGVWAFTLPTPLTNGTYQVEMTASQPAYSFIPVQLTTTIDTTPPVISGVSNGQIVQGALTITFNEGNGLLNGVAFTSGSSVIGAGTYTLIVTDLAGNANAVQFIIQDITITPSNNQIIYVNKNVVGGNKSGDSWANATPELAYALAHAKKNQNNWDEENHLKIWVAAGNYKPLYKVSDVNLDGGRENTFLMIPHIEVYGGFKGTETLLSQRDWYLNITTLDGDLAGDDSPGITGTYLSSHSTRQDNAYHVVTYLDIPTHSTILDGFHIVNANANKVQDITAYGNKVRHSTGGGVFVEKSFTNLKNLVIRNNSAINGGGMYVAALGVPSYGNYPSVVVNTVFDKNHADSNGSAIHCEAELLRLINSAVLPHTRDVRYGGGIAVTVYQQNYTISNCIFKTGATSAVSVTQFDNVRNCIIGYNSDNGNIDASTLTLDDLLVDYNAGDYRLKAGSRAINAGSNTLYNVFGNSTSDHDLAMEDRVSGSSIDIGPFEFQENCIAVTTPTTTATTQVFCESTIPLVSDLQATPATNTTLYWYTASTGGTPLASTETLNTGTYTLYAESANAECTSPTRLPVNVTVYTLPHSPTISSATITYSQYEVSQPLAVTPSEGYTLNWYNSAHEYISQPTPSTDVIGTITYFVSQSESLVCQSPQRVITVKVLPGAIVPNENGIVYVKKNVAGGNGSGNSWTHATPELAYVLEYAQTNSAIKEIWVATGTYTPLYQGDGNWESRNVDNIFNITNLKIYGGFNGTEDTREARNWKSNPTIISGNIGNVDSFYDNTLKLVKSVDATLETILDGFILEKANRGTSNISFSNSSARHIINHCIIRDNESMAGTVEANSMADMLIANTLFLRNTGYQVGGFMNYLGTLTSQQVKIVNTIFAKNTGQNSGGIENYGQLSIANSIFWNNTSRFSSTHDIYTDSETDIIVSNTITQVYGSVSNGRTTNNLVGAYPWFTDPNNDDYSLLSYSPAVNAGDNSLYDDSILGAHDLNGGDRIRDTTIDIGVAEVQTGNNPLPVTLIHFTAKTENHVVRLNWNTTEEMNSSYFLIERSSDAQIFETVGKIDAFQIGSHTYEFIDTHIPLQPLTYYRLRMVDLDGSFAYSRKIVVENALVADNAKLIAYPNPLIASNVLYIKSLNTCKATLFDLTGKSIQTISLEAGENRVSLPHLSSGIYFLTTDLRQVIKLVIMK
jgi:hypothetical protein